MSVRLLVLLLLGWFAVSALLGFSFALLSTLARRRPPGRLGAHVPGQVLRR